MSGVPLCDDGSPKAVFVDGTVANLLLDSVDPEGHLRVDTRCRASFEDFQFKLTLSLQVAGCLRLYDDDLALTAPLPVIGNGIVSQWLTNAYTLGKGEEWGKC